MDSHMGVLLAGVSIKCYNLFESRPYVAATKAQAHREGESGARMMGKNA